MANQGNNWHSDLQVFFIRKQAPAYGDGTRVIILQQVLNKNFTMFEKWDESCLFVDTLVPEYVEKLSEAILEFSCWNPIMF